MTAVTFLNITLHIIFILMNLIETLKNIDYKRIGYHILFWVVISVFYDAVSSILSERPFFEMLLHDLKFFFPSDVLGVYITLYLLIN